MKDRDLPDNAVYMPGRLFFEQLPPSDALLEAIAARCRHHAVSAATFSLTGVLSRVTVGAFDQKQQVYVTQTESGSLEILNCTGTIQFQGDTLHLSATVLVSDITGKISGGRLFAPTHGQRVYLVLQELIAQPGPSKDQAEHRLQPSNAEQTGGNLTP